SQSDASLKAPIVLQARALEPARTRARDTLCRIVLSADGVSVSASATNKPLYEISYGQIVSVSYSHGIDPPTAARAASSSVVRATTGVRRPESNRAGVNAPRGMDWGALRTTKPKAEFVVLRFEAEADARRAAAASAERLPIPPRETRESPR